MNEMWDQRYAGEEYVYGTLPNVFFKEKIEGLHPGKLLLPAEGEGRNAVFAASLGWQVKAIDFSRQARIKALKLAELRGIQLDYTIEDLTTIDFGTELHDAAGLIYFHLSPEFRKTVHQRIMKSIRPGGYIILEAFNINQTRNSSGGPSQVEMLFSIPMLQDDFIGMDILLLEETTVNLDQGSGHQGEAAIIRFFARKPERKH